MFACQFYLLLCRELIDDPVLKVNLDGTLSFEEAKNATTFYSLKTEPGEQDFEVYSSPISLPDGGKIHYFAKDNSGDYSTDIITEEIGISRELWKTVPANKMQEAVDNDPKNFALSKSGEIVIDLGKNETFGGFSYLPRQDGKKEGMIFEYEFYSSKDGKSWGQPVISGTFSNIENNPVQQKVKFSDRISGRFIRLVAKSDVRQSDMAAFAEVGIYQ